MTNQFAISIVLYNPNLDKLILLLNKIRKYNSNIKIFLIDNSTKKNKLNEFSDSIIYIKNRKNIGYGKGHNISIKKCLDKGIKRLFVINYDIDFTSNIFLEMTDYMSVHKDIGLMMPRVLSKNLNDQFLPKIQPNFLSIFKRKINNFTKVFFKKFISDYEGRLLNTSLNYKVTNLSGCFLLFNLELLKSDAYFDNRFFLYFEDCDLSRKLYLNYNLILFNNSSIIHDYYSGANREFKLLFLFLKSYFIFFNKWGWFKNIFFIEKNIISEYK